MSKVKLIAFTQEDSFNVGLTLGNVYDVSAFGDAIPGEPVYILDDDGDVNWLASDEWSLVE